VDDGTVAALEYERECRRYSEEMFTSFHRGDTYYIFWIGPRDWRTLQALASRRALLSYRASHYWCSVHEEHPFIRVSEGLTTEVLAVYGYLETRRCTRHVDTLTPVTSSG